MKVTNRSDGSVGYTLPEFNIRRVFNIGETKEIELKELEALYSTDGGAQIIKHFLLVDDKDWVKSNIYNAPIEYFWGINEIRKCLIEDDIELFTETLDYAPQGVIDLIKDQAWKMPISDLNKIQVIREKTGFNVQAAIKNMRLPEGETKVKAPIQRKRKEA